MKRFLLAILLSVVCCGLYAQTVTLVTPLGLEEPYEVNAGTSVTLQWKAGSAPTRFLSYTAEPELDPYAIDTRWTQYTNFTANGDGTYNFTLPLNATLYLWAGNKFDFTGMWTYSNVIKISIASGVKITAADGYLCPGTDSETLSVTGTYASYQWYYNNESIPGATAATYAATQPGQYKVQVPLSGKSVFSNTLHIRTAEVTMAGSLSGNTLTLKTSDGAASYQWLSGSSAAALSPIASATAQTYNATLTASKVYYAARAVKAGCTVQSAARPASTAIFAKPVVTMNAPTNANGKTCEGTQVSLSVPDQYASYVWYKDNVLYTDGANTLQLYNGSGNYKAEVTTTEWPEVAVSSDPKKVTYFVVTQPVLSGVKNGSYCPGESVTITLVDEGYPYKWYKHTDYNYTEADKIDVDGFDYTFTVTQSEYITVVADYLGCQATSKLYIPSFAGAAIYPELSDYSQTYLCPGKSVDIYIPAGEADNYENIQWFELAGDSYSAIDGATQATYTITNPGTYRVSASPKGCVGVVITSDPTVIQDNTERMLFIDSDQGDICVGGKATLSVSSDWTSIQWLEKKIVFGTNTGYDETYVPISGAGTANTLTVSKFTGYQVKARHIDCTTGIKVTSQVFELKPSVNPNITTDPDKEVSRWRKAPYDSIASYIYCDNTPLMLTLPAGYASYKWYSLAYNGDDDYELGNEIEGATTNTLELNAYGAIWYTAMVEADGCKGLSDPVLIDTYVHSLPAIADRNNSELCHPGDSTMLNNAFVSDNWVKYEWYRNGIAIPDSNNDTLYAKEPGGYHLVAFPEECPEIGYSSGIPVQVKFLEKAVIYENDTVLWATPWMGYYTYQWYVNGTPIPQEEVPSILHKNKMKSGEYTVEVANPTGCSTTSEPYTWIITSNEQGIGEGDFAVYPNPTSGGFSIKGLPERSVQAISIYNTQGVVVQRDAVFKGLQFNLAAQVPGVYIIEALLTDGSTKKAKVIRH